MPTGGTTELIMTTPVVFNPSPTGAAPAPAQVQTPTKSGGGKNAQNCTGMCDEKTVEYLRDLFEEKKTIENNKEENATKKIVLRLLDQGKKKLKRKLFFNVSHIIHMPSSPIYDLMF